MRKRFKKKARSCPLCKPNKTGGACRWSDKEKDKLKEDEKICLESTKKNFGKHSEDS